MGQHAGHRHGGDGDLEEHDGKVLGEVNFLRKRSYVGGTGGINSRMFQKEPKPEGRWELLF